MEGDYCIVKIKVLHDFGGSVYNSNFNEITEYTWAEGEIYSAMKKESTVVMCDKNFNCVEFPMWEYYEYVKDKYFEEV